MAGAASRNKGAAAERRVVAWFRAHGFPHVRRYLSGDGRQPGDIDGVLIGRTSPQPWAWVVPACVEVKDQATYDLAGWMRQAETEALDGQVPLVVFHPHGEADVGRWFVLTRLQHLYPDQETTP